MEENVVGSKRQRSISTSTSSRSSSHKKSKKHTPPNSSILPKRSNLKNGSRIRTWKRNEDGTVIRFAPTANIHGSDDVSMDILEYFADNIRKKHKTHKSHKVYNYILRPEYIDWKIKDKELKDAVIEQKIKDNELESTNILWETDKGTVGEIFWPSRRPNYFQSDEDYSKAKKEIRNESNFFGKWDISNIDDEGNVTLCHKIKNICVFGVLVTAAFIADRIFAGKKKSKKTRRRSRK
jgi:hypothetical protein